MTHIKVLKEKVGYDGRFVQIIEKNFQNEKTGEPGVWEVVQRKTLGKIVAIAPVTEDNQIILIKSYRIPQKSYVLELCAGIQDKPNENEIDLAKRELLEETGYSVEKIEKLYEGPFNSGLTTDELIVFAGYEAKKVQKQQLEAGEDIEVLKVPLKDFKNFLLSPPKNTKVDIKLFSLLVFLFNAK